MSRTWIWLVVFTSVWTSHGITEGEAAATGILTDRAATDHAATNHAATDHAATDHAATDHAATDHAATDHAADALATTISRDLPLSSGSLVAPVDPTMPLPVETSTAPLKEKSRQSPTLVTHERPGSPDDKRLKKLLGEISKFDLWAIFAFPDEGDERNSPGEDVTVTDLFNHVRDIIKWDQVTSREIVGLARDYLEDMLRDFLELADRNTSAFAKGGELLLMEALKLMPDSFKEGVYLFSRAVEVDVGHVNRPDGRSISGHQNQKRLINPALGVTCPAMIRELIYCWIYDIFEIGTELAQYVDLRSYIPYNFVESMLNNL